MSDYKVGDHITVKLSGGRLVTAMIKANVETTEGERLQVSFGNETALIYLWQVVEKLRKVDCPKISVTNSCLTYPHEKAAKRPLPNQKHGIRLSTNDRA